MRALATLALLVLLTAVQAARADEPPDSPAPPAVPPSTEPATPPTPPTPATPTPEAPTAPAPGIAPAPPDQPNLPDMRKIEAEIRRAEAILRANSERLRELSRRRIETSPTPPTPPVAPMAPFGDGAQFWSWGENDPNESSARTVHIDTVFAVDKGTLLKLGNFAGDVNVKAWGRSAVRLVAERRHRDRIRIARGGNVLAIESVSMVGSPSVEYQMTVPDWMPVKVNGIETDITVSGIDAFVEAETMRGDVHVLGGSGPRKLSSVEGDVQVVGARGDVQAESMNNGVRLERVSGNIDVESVNGDIRLQEIDSGNVDASSLNGSVVFLGKFLPHGRYRLASHHGNLMVGVPEHAGVDVSVAAYNGNFQSGFPLELAPPLRGRRFNFTLGQGGSSLDLESFQGLVELVRPGKDLMRRLKAPTSPPKP